MRKTVLFLFALLYLIPTFAQTESPNAALFTRILDGTFYMDRFSTYGVSWCDYNNDGKEDLFAVNNGGPLRLYKNNGDGTFFYDSLAGFASFNANFMAATWGDYDNDGWQDVFVTTTAINGPASHRNYLFKNNGDNTFTSVTGEVTNCGGWALGAAWGDYDNDGFLDLFVANWDSANVLYHNLGDGTFARVNVPDMTTINNASYSCTWVDYNNDGNQDLFVTNYYTTTYPPQQDELYRNDGNGNFTRITTGELVTDTTLTTGSSWGDYDNDGNLDVFVSSVYFHTGDKNMLFHNNGDGTFTKMAAAVPSLDVNTSYGSGWADYNNDGYLDLYVSANRSGQRANFLYENNGDGSFTKITSSAINTSGENSFGGAWGDYNDDGFPDLYVATGSSSKQNQFFRNNDTVNNWIKLHLVANISNRSAIGARIICYADSMKQTRILQGNTGEYSQGSLYPVFGLGSRAQADSIVVLWPSGKKDVYTNVSARTILVSNEGETSLPVELNSFTASQNNSDVEIRWTTATEINNKGFELYRDSKLIANVTGNGTTTQANSYSIKDKNVPAGSHQYRLVQVDFDGTRSEKVLSITVTPVLTYNLEQNYPNPFNPSTMINFSIAKMENVKITLYDALGKEVNMLINKIMEAGNHQVVFNGKDLPSGIYFYKLTAGSYTSVKKMMLIK